LKVTPEQLRAVGLSRSKALYVANIAAEFSSDDLALDNFEKLSDDDVKKELIKIKGIGPWSAEMFLIFSLKRPDVFSVGDLGLRTAIEKLYGISRDDKKEILALAETWRPHRTLASRLLWASLEKV
ncbi:MAG: DNA-3-methyladenine glycosylase 2 family protein, partial [Microgenomates group bacterium]